MEFPPQLLQFVGSLIGILALAGLAIWLKLGPAPTLTSEEEARFAADEAVSGFVPTSIGLDRNGSGAIMRDEAGRLLLLRPHGTKFAGRLLTANARMRLAGDQLTIDTAERRYGAYTLSLDDASAWVQALEEIKSADHA